MFWEVTTSSRITARGEFSFTFEDAYCLQFAPTGHCRGRHTAPTGHTIYLPIPNPPVLSLAVLFLICRQQCFPTQSLNRSLGFFARLPTAHFSGMHPSALPPPIFYEKRRLVCPLSGGVRILHHLAPNETTGDWTAGTLVSSIPKLVGFAEDHDVRRGIVSVASPPSVFFCS